MLYNELLETCSEVTGGRILVETGEVTKKGKAKLGVIASNSVIAPPALGTATAKQLNKFFADEQTNMGSREVQTGATDSAISTKKLTFRPEKVAKALGAKETAKDKEDRGIGEALAGKASQS